MECWNCQAESHRNPFCPACGKVQPRAPGATLFEAFALQPSVDLDRNALERSFRERSLQVHPDRFARADARERRLSLEQSTALNEAYKTLKDPARRAFYLLKLQGVDLDREDAGTQKDMPLPFLEEVMELRETLDGLKRTRDLPAARGMAEEVRRRRDAALEEAQAALRELLTPGADTRGRPAAAHALARVRYFDRFLDEVDAMEEAAL